MKRRYQQGINREVQFLLPPSIDDYVSKDHYVRVIDSYVDSLDLTELGFLYSAGEINAGQPAYNPADLLKLYIYGYLNRIRSSRRLEAETKRNLELIWLLKSLCPSNKTISNFRKDNSEALTAANRDFIILCKELELLGGELVALDGAFFHGNASNLSIITKNKIKKNIERIEKAISEYHAEMDRVDKLEDSSKNVCLESKVSLKDLQSKLKSYKNQWNELKESGEGQISKTDPDARLLTKSGQKVAGYNVQIVVDEKYKLLVSGEVTNDGNDSGQLHNMASQAKSVLEVEKLNVVADVGYYQQEQIKKCLDEGITPYVPKPNKSSSAKIKGKFNRKDFQYDSRENRYICPANKYLNCTGTEVNRGKTTYRYRSESSVCKKCSLRDKCLPEKTSYKQIHRWVHEDMIEEHDKRMLLYGDEFMKKRGSLAEHPFGTLKVWCGWTHFLVRGKRKVSGEWNLLMLVYNFKRVLNILGLERFKEICSMRMSAWEQIQDRINQMTYSLLRRFT
ncbi:MAG: IS1182 family transposase [Spirochaetota bacterium]|nr:IS1182 family transposase [Spirochaetota bacterium]